MIFLLNEPKSQTMISRRANEKKSSKSGGAKKAMGVRRSKEQFEGTLCFFGAGGHVKIGGIWNRGPFGVEQPLEVTSTPSSTSMMLIFDKWSELVIEELTAKSMDISLFFDRLSRFLYWVLLGFLVLLFLLLLDEAIWENIDGTCTKKSARQFWNSKQE